MHTCECDVVGCIIHDSQTQDSSYKELKYPNRAFERNLGKNTLRENKKGTGDYEEISHLGGMGPPHAQHWLAEASLMRMD